MEVCSHQEELVCRWGECTQACMIPTDTNSFRQGWESIKRKKKYSRQEGRKKEERHSNIKEKTASTRWSKPGEKPTTLCRQQFPFKSMGDTGYSPLLPVRRLTERNMCGIGSQALAKYFCKFWHLSVSTQQHWRMGLRWLPPPIYASKHKPGLESGPFPLLPCV